MANFAPALFVTLHRAATKADAAACAKLQEQITDLWTGRSLLACFILSDVELARFCEMPEIDRKSLVSEVLGRRFPANFRPKHKDTFRQ